MRQLRSPSAASGSSARRRPHGLPALLAAALALGALTALHLSMPAAPALLLAGGEVLAASVFVGLAVINRLPGSVVSDDDVLSWVGLVLPMLVGSAGIAAVALSDDAYTVLPLLVAVVAAGAGSNSAVRALGTSAALVAAGIAMAIGTGAPLSIELINALVLAFAVACAIHVQRRHAAHALQVARADVQAAESRSVLDPLTGLANRQGLLMLASPMLAAARRNGDAVHCIMVAVDGLRVVNDTMGKQAGDDIIVAVAGAVRGVMRGTDVVGRWGGNEICVIGPGVGMTMLDVEHRVRERLRAEPPVDRASWEPKVTAGGAMLAPWDEGDLDALLNRAELETYARRALRGTASRRRRRADLEL